MATTTNYGWTTPDDTALVKDGAAAIRTLGSSVDTTTKNLNPSTTLGDIEYRSSTANTNTRLGIGTTGQVLTVSGGVPAWATSADGLILIKTQTIGSAVSSVTVTDAFSSTYDNYLITINGGVGSTSNNNLELTLGATTTGYSFAGVYMNFNSNTVNGFSLNAGSYMHGGYFTTNTLSTEIVIQNPNLAKRTIFFSRTVAATATNLTADYKGFLDNNTQYTAFTFTRSGATATLTGGEIRVYGYRNS